MEWHLRKVQLSYLIIILLFFITSNNIVKKNDSHFGLRILKLNFGHFCSKEYLPILSAKR